MTTVFTKIGNAIKALVAFLTMEPTIGPIPSGSNTTVRKSDFELQRELEEQKEKQEQTIIGSSAWHRNAVKIIFLNGIVGMVMFVIFSTNIH